ncbi:hypothetical protein [Parahaliea aestuarii]|uniref:Uncharacterized protein n=1 Tax=Parahaliea aestuarii TaxID=1852021 RepID=A0A5C8ZLQ5_9GAMM|nr:hypothetical protein [Parahaliea aestuarii]TXS89413.1 hypothetical protein FVW59_18020 [Parahaliea aestuarii]
MQGNVVVHGADDEEGRALLVVSALHHCGKWLKENNVSVRFVAVAGNEVAAALNSLRFQTGLHAEVSSVCPVSNPDEVFPTAAIYVGVVTSSPDILSIPQAYRSTVSALTAVQFPDDTVLDASLLQNMALAYDPVLLSDRIKLEVQTRLKEP